MGHAGLYVHIPFCRRKCLYCDFNSYTQCESLYESYVAALCQEMRSSASAWQGTRFDTLFIGGGTPTVLPAEQIIEVVCACTGHLCVAPGAEITVEANPGTVSLADLRALRRGGVNRISLGVQSLHADELRLLGRIHSAEEAERAFRLAREAGLRNINLDLIYGLPGQPVGRWRETLLRALALEPEHLSLYALTVEESTPLAECIARGELPAPDDDAAADMYELAEELLARSGYVHYELSNWAREGRVCRHNLKYWRNEAYLGLGAGAHTYDGQQRSANVANPEEYIARIVAGASAIAATEQLDAAQTMGETMMLGLRLIEGISWTDFARRFGVSLRAVYGDEIGELAAQGLIEVHARGVRLTPRGRLLGNRVFAAFLR